MAQNIPDDPGPGKVVSSAPGPVPGQDVAGDADDGGYWTAERMLSATPDESLLPVEQAPLSYRMPVEGTQDDAPVMVAPERPSEKMQSEGLPESVPTVGKLFYVGYDNTDNVCSGAIVTSASGNLVLTAAHCVYRPKKGWNRNFYFVPDYLDGSGPHGGWYGKGEWVSSSWTDEQDYTEDQAFISFYSRYEDEGKSMQSYFGANGIMVGGGRARDGVVIYGYPAAPPYQGNRQYYCSGNAAWNMFTPDTEMACPMTPGASGGPWFASLGDEGTGVIYAVTSRRARGFFGTLYLYATPNKRNLIDLYNSANS